MDDGVGIAAVIREHVASDHRIRLKLVGSGGTCTRACGLIDICAVCVESKRVKLSQTSANVEWSRSIICVESKDWVGKGSMQGFSKSGVRREWTAFVTLTNP